MPIAQQIRYPDGVGQPRYTFSIWAFPEEHYLDAFKAYFEFSEEHYKRTATGSTCSASATASSPTRARCSPTATTAHVMTFDPVSTGDFGWDTFLREYNSLCSEHGGTPLFNQTNLLTRAQVARAFGDRMAYFEKHRQKYDPTNRLLNNFFRRADRTPTRRLRWPR